MLTGTQPQTTWAPWTRDIAEMLKIHLAEVKHKAQGRAETSAFWSPSSWKFSPHHDLIKELPALHAKPLPIGLRTNCSTGSGISDPPACSSALPGPWSTGSPDLFQNPTPQACMISLGCFPQACEAGYPQARMISPKPCLSGLHRPAGSPLGHTLQAHSGPHNLLSAGPAKPVIHRHSWSLLGPRPSGLPSWRSTSTHISTGPCPSGLPGPWSTGTHDLHSAGRMSFRHARPMLHRPG
jgi:hypothetical protein